MSILPERIQHPGVYIISVSEELVVAHGGVEAVLAQRHHVKQMVPLRQDVAEALLRSKQLVIHHYYKYGSRSFL